MEFEPVRAENADYSPKLRNSKLFRSSASGPMHTQSSEDVVFLATSGHNEEDTEVDLGTSVADSAAENLLRLSDIDMESKVQVNPDLITPKQSTDLVASPREVRDFE